MRTLVLSDLHLGSRTEVDVLRREDARAAMVAAVEGAGRLVLLGDTLELRHGPVGEAVEAGRPALEAIGDAVRPGAQIVLVPGNHDHALLAPWHERRALGGHAPLGLAERTGADASEALAELADMVRPARLSIAYPGVWLREDVYATHGHYLDRHITIPTFERIASGFMARVAGHVPDRATPEDYEAALAPLYAWLHVVARHTTSSFGAERQRGSQNAWTVLTAKGPRPLRHRLMAAGFPWAVRALNLAGAGPLRADISPVELRRAGLRAMNEVVDRLGIPARWVIFGHTHRPGPLDRDDPAEWGRLVNSGSWVHEETFLGRDPHDSPYFPGTYVEVDGQPGTPPRVANALRARGRA